MIEKWERQPFRVGMVAGFLLLPLLWIVQESILRFVNQTAPLNRFDILSFFFISFFCGPALGAGVSQALLAYRKGDLHSAKWHLMGPSGFYLFLISIMLGFSWAGFKRPPGRTLFLGMPEPIWITFLFSDIITKNLPLHLALLMFLVGLLMRSRR